MPKRLPPEVRHQVIELARSGTRVAQLAATFAVSQAMVYNWLKQDRIDRGEIDGLSTDQPVELAAAKRRTASKPGSGGRRERRSGDVFASAGSLTLWLCLTRSTFMLRSTLSTWCKIVLGHFASSIRST